jgi:hypothetical protein
MSRSSENVSKLCSTAHKLIDKKTIDKLSPLLKQLEDLKEDLNEKDRKNIYEVASRIARKFPKETEICEIASSIKLKFPKSEKSKITRETKKVN